MKVSMTNPKTGEIKDIKVGWSWILFLFSQFFGLPLFLRKLYVWGSIFFLFYISYLFILELHNEEGVANLLLGLNTIGLSIWLGIKGNEMTVKNYLELGWTFTNPDSDEVKFAKGKWGINI